MTAADLTDLLVRDLVRAHGGGAGSWRRAIGALRVYSRDTHAHCNWEAMPTGTARQIAIVERAVDALRPRHPFVDAPPA